MGNQGEMRLSAQTGLVNAKLVLRNQIMKRRNTTSPDVRATQDSARTKLVLEAVADLDVSVVACYLSHAPEPDTLDLVDKLTTVGIRVLVPALKTKTPGKPGGYPNWAWYEGPDHLTEGLWGIPEPTGLALGAATLEQAEVVICAALAAGSDGTRLGTGGGWYDRALAYSSPKALIVTLLFDGELFDTVPTEPHDRPIDAVVLPNQWVTVGTKMT